MFLIQTNLQLVQILLQALNPQVAMTASTIQAPGLTTPKYEELCGMRQEEIDLYLRLCGLPPGVEALLPQYPTRLAGINVLDATKDKIVTSQICNKKYYESHWVLITSSLLKIIKKWQYNARDPDLTLATEQKGLMLISEVLETEEKNQAINELHEFLMKQNFLPQMIWNN